jgi:hypothetical protein
MAEAVSWMVTGQVVQTLLDLLELMAAASAMAARTGRAKISKRMMKFIYMSSGCSCCKGCWWLQRVSVVWVACVLERVCLANECVVA